MKNKKKLLIGIIPILVIGTIIHNRPISKIITVESNTYGAPANNAFKDENFYKCVVDNYNYLNKTNYGYDVNLTDEQLSSMFQLFCDYGEENTNKIVDISGIEKLNNIKYLSLTRNDLIDVDLHNNTLLEKVYLGHNDDLNNVNLKGLTNLKILRINLSIEGIDFQNHRLISGSSGAGSFRKLKQLDLTDNINLKELYIFKSNITELDLKNNNKLEILSLSENELHSLDLSNNIKLKTLNADGNKIENINFGYSPDLTYINIDSNILKNIDLSKVPNLNTYLNQFQERKIYINPYDCKNQVIDDDVLLAFLNDNNYPTNVCSLFDATYQYYGNYDNLEYITKNSYYTTKNDGIVYHTFKYTIYPQFIMFKPIYYTSSPRIKNYVISDEKKYIFTEDITDVDYIFKDISATNSSGKIENGKYILSYNDNLQKEYDLINISSDKYFISDTHYIYTNGDVDTNVIKENINLTSINNVTGNIENNRYVIKYDDEIITEYYIVYTQSDNYLINHEKGYIYTGTDTKNDIIEHNINIANDDYQYDKNCLSRVVKNGFDNILTCGLSYEIDNNKYSIYNKYWTIENNNIKTGKYRSIGRSNLIKTFDLINIKSDRYYINDADSYIYLGLDTDENTIKSNIELTQVEYATGNIENNKYIVKYNDDIIKEYDLVSIRSNKYDLNKEYLYGNYEDIKNNVDVTNGNISLNLITNKIEIKHNDNVLQEFNYVNYTSDKYDLGNSHIKVSDNDISSFLSNISCINCNVYVYDGSNNLTTGNFGENYKLRITYNDEVLKEFDLKYAVNGVELNADNLNLNLDSKKTYQLSANITPTYASNKNVTWTSSNPGVATVDNNGLVTAKSLGEATITVKTEDGEYTDTCNVVVSEITTYTVTYKDENNTYTEEYEEGENIIFKSDLEKKGYKLIGFKYNNKDYKLTDKLMMPSSDIELVAIWELVIPEIKNYSTNESDINGISLKTDVSNINLGIESIYNVKVSNHDGTDKTSGLIATGDKIRIYLDELLVNEYEVIIKGDVTGTGTSTVSDVAKLYQYLKKKINMDECFIKAGNVVDSDNEIKVNDVAKLYQFIKGKIDSL